MSNQLVNVLENKLYISKDASVHPNLILRTPLFTSKKTKGLTTIDATETLCDSAIFKSEGYDYVNIIGPTLSVSLDFKIWCGVLFSFYKYGYETDSISLSFIEFAKLCGFPSRRLNKVLRDTIEKSLLKLSMQSIHFKTNNSKKTKFTSLILKGSFDADNDIISLTADPEIWELYAIDHQILLNLSALNNLAGSETAQCLYLFFASLPKNPLPVSLKRIRDRLKLSMANKESNRSIKTAIKRLEDIGYLMGEWVTWNDAPAYKITKRNKNLAQKKKIKV